MIRCTGAFCLWLILLATSASAQIAAARDVAYGPHPAQAYDVYFDPTQRAAPMIVMLHGGAWAFGKKEAVSVWQAKSAHFVPQGHVFVSVETRLLGDGADPRRQAHDFARAVAHLRANAARWGGDASHVVLMGHSAGAHIAALVGADAGLRRVSGPLAGVVVLDTGALDLVGLMEDRPRRVFTNAFGTDPAYWAAASPREHLGAGAPPYLVVCRLRGTVCEGARRFAARARQMGVAVSIMPTEKSHREINADVGVDPAYTAVIDRWLDGVLR